MRASLLLLLVAIPTSAQTSLKQLLDAADQQNVDRRIAAESHLRADAEYRMAWTALFPSFTAQGSITHNEVAAVIPAGVLGPKQLVITPADQINGSLRFDLPLVDTNRWYRAIVTSVAQDAAVDREEFTRDQVRRSVIFGYYFYAAALAVRESAKRSLGVSEAQLKLQEIRSSAGAITELDLLRARAEVLRTRQVVADTENLVATSRRGLQSTTSLDPGEIAALPPDDLTPEPRFEELEMRTDALPGVRAADRDAAMQQKLADAQSLVLVPVLGAQFTETLSNATGFTGKAATFNTGLYLTWRIDVPTFTAMGAQRAISNTARLALEKMQVMSRDQIHADWQRHHAALIKVEAAQAQVQAAQRAAQVARDRYSAGAGTQLDVIQSERDVFTAEVGQIQARTELASARAGLRISAGLPLGID